MSHRSARSQRPRLYWAWLATSLIALCACATPQTPDEGVTTVATARPQASKELQGQLSIKLDAFNEQAAKGISLGFFFSGNDELGQLDLMTLMGSQIAQVGWTPKQAWLSNDKGQKQYPNLDTLTQEALGEPLPLRALIHWMAGEPDPSQASESGDQAGRFTQLGWQIDAQNLANKRLQATRTATATQRGVHLKVYLDR